MYLTFGRSESWETLRAYFKVLGRVLIAYLKVHYRVDLIDQVIK